LDGESRLQGGALWRLTCAVAAAAQILITKLVCKTKKKRQENIEDGNSGKTTVSLSLCR